MGVPGRDQGQDRNDLSGEPLGSPAVPRGFSDLGDTFHSLTPSRAHIGVDHAVPAFDRSCFLKVQDEQEWSERAKLFHDSRFEIGRAPFGVRGPIGS